MKIQTNNISIVLVLTLSFLVSACSSKEQELKEGDVLLTSYRLIDEQRTDEAISLLELELKKNQGDYDLQVALASAYAHKGGFKIQKLMPAFKSADEIKKLAKERKKQQKPSTEKPKKEEIQLTGSDRTTRDISDLLVKASKFVNIYTSIPSITVEEAVYLNHAIYLLDELKSSILPPEALYRAVLRIVQLKHLIAKDFQENEFSSEGFTCNDGLTQGTKRLLDVSQVIVHIISDLVIVNPKDAEVLNSITLQISESVSHLTSVSTSLIVLEETSNAYLQQSAIQQGFGNLFKCGKVGLQL